MKAMRLLLLGFTLVFVSFLVKLLGESPVHVWQVFFQSAFGSSYDFAMTLVYATPLLLTGLAVGIPFRAGWFNVGAEGQLLVGAFGAVLMGTLSQSFYPAAPTALAQSMIVCAAAISGALYAAIPAWLKLRRGSHEVITTILLNFIAMGLTNYAVLYVFPNRESQSPESVSVPTEWMWQPFEWTEGAPLTRFSLIAVGLALLAAWILYRTRFGLWTRVAGSNPQALENLGVSTQRVQFWSFVAGGAVAGCVGALEVLGVSGCFRMGFSPEYGFMGIAVALFARAHPVGILFSAFLFGALHKGASALDLETETVTRELAMVIQALIVFAVSANLPWKPQLNTSLVSWRKKGGKHAN